MYGNRSQFNRAQYNSYYRTSTKARVTDLDLSALEAYGFTASYAVRFEFRNQISQFNQTQFNQPRIEIIIPHVDIVPLTAEAEIAPVDPSVTAEKAHIELDPLTADTHIVAFDNAEVSRITLTPLTAGTEIEFVIDPDWLYTVWIRDDYGNLVAVLENSHDIRYHKLFNEANELSFSLPATDPKADLLNMATRFEIWKGTLPDDPRASGKIVRRDTTDDPIIITGMSNEIEMEGSLVPANVLFDENWGSSVLGPGVRLKDIFEQLTYDYRSETINRSIEDYRDFALTDDIIDFSLGDRVALAKEDTGETEEVDDQQWPVYLYPEIEAGDLDGRIGFEFEVPDGYHPHRLRFVAKVGATNDIIYRYRYSSDGGMTWSGWQDGPEQGWPLTPWPQDRPEKIGFPLDAEGADLIQVQFQFVNEDGGTTLEPVTRTEGTDAQGNDIVVYGSTPILDAVEMIYRQNSDQRSIRPHTHEWPSEPTPAVHNAEFSHDSHIDVAVTLAENYGYEFYVDEDLRLHLKEQIGTNRERDTIFREKHNMNIDQLEDDDSELANILVCLGDGSGIDQLRTVLRDEDSIADYGPRPARFENSDIDIPSDLEEAGQQELERRKEPIQRFYIHGIPERHKEWEHGDVVGIAVPDADLLTSGRIEEVDVEVTDNEYIRLGINDTLASLVDEMTRIPKDLPIIDSSAPEPPTNLTASSRIEAIEITWRAKGEGRVYVSEEKDGEYRFLEQVRGRYRHELPPGTTRYYKVSQARNEAESELEGPVRGTARFADPDSLPVEDKPPENIQLEGRLESVEGGGTASIVASWDEEPEATWYQMRYRRTDIDDEWAHEQALDTTHKLVPVLPNIPYEVQVRSVARDFASPWAPPDSATITTPKDTEAPSPPEFVDWKGIVQGIQVTLSPPPEPDWDQIIVYAHDNWPYTPGPQYEVARGRQTFFEIGGLEPLRTYYVQAIAIDTSGNKSDPTDEV